MKAELVRWPWGLIGMLALIGTIERCVIRGNLALAEPRATSWSHTARKLPRAARYADILCFGDSMVKCGMLPSMLRERTGRAAYNLAVVGGSAPSSYFLLRRALNAGARPSTIVVNFNQDLLSHGPASKTKPYPLDHLLDLRETVELCWMARDPALLAAISLARLLPSVQCRSEVRAYVQLMLRGEKSDRAGIMLLLFRNWNFNKGAMIDPKRWFFDNSGIADAERNTSAWRPDPVNVHYFHAFLDLAARHRIRVVWLLPPVSPGTQIIWEARGDESLFDRFIREQLRRHPHVVVVDSRHSGYKATEFHDQVHVDRDGALSLSLGVGNLLARGGLDPDRGTRWVQLPAFQYPTPAVPLEDLRESSVSANLSLTKTRGLRR
jgi:hypothetical protein